MAHLTTVDNSIQAELVCNKLRNHGIEPIIFNEHFTTLMPQYYGMMGSGIQNKVKDSDQKYAIEILDLNSQSTVCPNCKSNKIEFKSNNSGFLKSVFYFIALIFFIPIGNVINSCICKDCDYEFKV
ncbi:MAG: DUF2007 domain-containing protein [Cytophagales bacterium]